MYELERPLYGPLVPVPQSLAKTPTSYLEELMARDTQAVLVQNSLPPQVDNPTHYHAPVHHNHHHDNRQITVTVNLSPPEKENLLKRTLKKSLNRVQSKQVDAIISEVNSRFEDMHLPSRPYETAADQESRVIDEAYDKEPLTPKTPDPSLG